MAQILARRFSLHVYDVDCIIMVPHVYSAWLVDFQGTPCVHLVIAMLPTLRNRAAGCDVTSAKTVVCLKNASRKVGTRLSGSYNGKETGLTS